MAGNQFLNFTGKTILITGAASGIGRAAAETLSELGANLILIDREGDRLAEVASSLHGNVSTFELNLCDFAAIDSTIRNIAAEKGLLHGIVHCAGISSRKPLNTLRPEGFRTVMDVNFFAFEELVRLCMKRGRFADGGSIVVMSSISAIRGYKAKTEYCVSKAAVDAFVRCMAAELAPRRIRINSIMAAEVLTPMALKARELNASVGASDFNAPLGPTEPYEVANTIAFLLSDATRTITGTALLIDGGATLN